VLALEAQPKEFFVFEPCVRVGDDDLAAFLEPVIFVDFALVFGALLARLRVADDARLVLLPDACSAPGDLKEREVHVDLELAGDHLVGLGQTHLNPALLLDFQLLLRVQEPFLIHIHFEHFACVIGVGLIFDFAEAGGGSAVFAPFPLVADNLAVLVLAEYFADLEFSEELAEVGELHLEHPVFECLEVKRLADFLGDVEQVLFALAALPLSVAPRVAQLDEFDAVDVKHIGYRIAVVHDQAVLEFEVGILGGLALEILIAHLSPHEVALVFVAEQFLVEILVAFGVGLSVRLVVLVFLLLLLALVSERHAVVQLDFLHDAAGDVHEGFSYVASVQPNVATLNLRLGLLQDADPQLLAVAAPAELACFIFGIPGDFGVNDYLLPRPIHEELAGQESIFELVSSHEELVELLGVRSHDGQRRQELRVVQCAPNQV